MSDDDKIEKILPGVTAAYKALRTDQGTGIYTSNGAFYNHTFFGRDTALIAGFAAVYDKAFVEQAIMQLVKTQGMTVNTQTQEQPGRIFHELRDYRTWQPTTFAEGAIGKFLGLIWGARDRRLLTYFAADTPALFIRVVSQYVDQYGTEILARNVTHESGAILTVAEAMARSADWLRAHTDETGRMKTERSNWLALPFQTLQDSVTSYVRTDQTLANYKQPISYVEVQAWTADALESAARWLPQHASAQIWTETTGTLRQALMTQYWDDTSGYFASAIDSQGSIDTRNVSAGFTLDTNLWDDLPAQQRQRTISSIVDRLFSEEFLTIVGVRTRSLAQSQALAGVIEYHGSNSVWPIYTFLMIEGLRRHNLHRLAEQLQNRLLNGLNYSRQFDEFFIVNRAGELVRPASAQEPADMSAVMQMVPEERIAQTVAPALLLAQRVHARESRPAQEPWQRELEARILARIPPVSLATPSDAATAVGTVRHRRYRRVLGNAKSTWYFVTQSLRLKRAKN